MPRYTARQVNRALAQEQLLLRLDQGEDLEPLCQQLGVSIQPSSLAYLRRRYRQGGCSWEALIDRRQGHAFKMTPERRAWLREQKRQHPALTQAELAQRFADRFKVSISQGRISTILHQEGVALPGGQHDQAPAAPAVSLERAGVFFPPGGAAADAGGAHGDPGDPGAAAAGAGH